MPPRAIQPAEKKEETTSPSPLTPTKPPISFKKRDKITSVACNACQKRKRKCNGARPTCAACEASGKVDDCTYTYDGDQSRSSAIRTKNTQLEAEVERLSALILKLKPVEEDSEQWARRLEELGGSITKIEEKSSASASSSTPLKSEESTLATQDLSTSQQHMQLLHDHAPTLDLLIDPQLAVNEPQGPTLTYSPLGAGPDTLGLARTFGAYPIRYGILESRLQLPVPDDQRRSLGQPIHTTQPLNFEDFPPDDGISTVESMSSFISAFRGYATRLVAQNVPVNEILGPSSLDVQAFFKKEDFRQARTVSTFVPRFVSNFDLLGLKEKLAFSIIINLVIRWQLFPNRKTYAAMPPWLRPTPAQCFLPHFSSIEYLAWPGIRDIFIYAPHQYINILSAAFKFQWDHSDADMFVYDSVSDLATGISQAFMDRVADLDNWMLDEGVLDLWPAIEGKAAFVKMSAG